MQKINSFFVAIIQLLLLVDSTRQSYVKQGITTLKTISKTLKSPLFNRIGNTMKKPIFTVFGNTMKNPVNMFRRNKNTIKNIASGVQKKYMGTSNYFGSKTVKCLREVGIKNFKYTAPQTTKGGMKLVRTSGKTNIQMRTAEQMKGKEIGSLINMVSRSKPQLPFLFVAGGLNRLTVSNLVPEELKPEKKKVDGFKERKLKRKLAFLAAQKKNKIKEEAREEIAIEKEKTADWYIDDLEKDQIIKEKGYQSLAAALEQNDQDFNFTDAEIDADDPSLQYHKLPDPLPGQVSEMDFDSVMYETDKSVVPNITIQYSKTEDGKKDSEDVKKLFLHFYPKSKIEMIEDATDTEKNLIFTCDGTEFYDQNKDAIRVGCIMDFREKCHDMIARVRWISELPHDKPKRKADTQPNKYWPEKEDKIE